jgi:hypothetical protein
MGGQKKRTSKRHQDNFSKNPLEGNWSKYGMIGQKINKRSLFGMFCIVLLWTGEKQIITKMVCKHSFQDQKGQLENISINLEKTNSGMISSAFSCLRRTFGQKLVSTEKEEKLSTETRELLG